MTTLFESTILKGTGADTILTQEVVQTLWKGYGEIKRVRLEGGTTGSVIVKYIHFPDLHRKGKRSADTLSHSRKLKSYRVEAAWYSRWSSRCGKQCRVPDCLGVTQRNNELVLVMEDLDAAGFPRRCSDPTWAEITTGLRWLAEFHAIFIGVPPDDLWKTGTYWHLDTRPDELKSLSDPPLRSAADRIDRKLRETIRTIVHGDAKIQNFCFTRDGTDAAAVDFQYTGGGCGMKDVAYFAASCVHEATCAQWEDDILDTYFNALTEAIKRKDGPVDAAEVESQWRPLYHLAWVDFHRFYKGWSGYRFPEDSYSERLAKQVVDSLNRHDR